MKSINFDRIWSINKIKKVIKQKTIRQLNISVVRDCMPDFVKRYDIKIQTINNQINQHKIMILDNSKRFDILCII